MICYSTTARNINRWKNTTAKNPITKLKRNCQVQVSTFLPSDRYNFISATESSTLKTSKSGVYGYKSFYCACHSFWMSFQTDTRSTSIVLDYLLHTWNAYIESKHNSIVTGNFSTCHNYNRVSNHSSKVFKKFKTPEIVKKNCWKTTNNSGDKSIKLSLTPSCLPQSYHVFSHRQKEEKLSLCFT